MLQEEATEQKHLKMQEKGKLVDGVRSYRWEQKGSWMQREGLTRLGRQLSPSETVPNKVEGRASGHQSFTASLLPGE